MIKKVLILSIVMLLIGALADVVNWSTCGHWNCPAGDFD